MSTPFLLVLLACSAVLLVLRLATPLLPSRRAVPIGPLDVAVLVLAAAGLVFHCTAMFFPEQTAVLPFSDGASAAVRRMDTASVVLYAVPAALVLLALRRIRWTALVAVAVALVAVGVTMYDGSPLDVHLATIALAVFAISLTAAGLVSGVGHRRPQSESSSSVSRGTR